MHTGNRSSRELRSSRSYRFQANLAVAWVSLFLAPVTMVVGHMGSHELSWTADHISTYAAHARHGNWISASMLLAALALVCIGISIVRDRELGKNYLGQVASMVLGAAVSGLLVLAAFQETAPDRKTMLSLSFEALRQQAFHENGLFVFFLGAIIAAVIAGLAVILNKAGFARKTIGAVIAASGPIAAAAMSHSWPKYFGIAGNSSGIRQRAAFLILWIGGLLLLALLTKGFKEEKRLHGGNE